MRLIELLALSMLIGCPPPPEPLPPPPPPFPLPVPEPEPEIAADAPIDVATFHQTHCLLRHAGDIACWGKNTYGQLGDGTRDDRASLLPVQGVDDAEQLAIGRDYACALRRGGRVACWGNNEDGQLGNGAGPKPGVWSLSAVELALSDVVQISGGEYHACAVDGGRRVHCWGNSANGQAGSSDARAFGEPRGVALKKVKQIASGANHVCALLSSRKVMCWGRHTEGQLGANVSGSRPSPVDVEGVGDVAMIASGHKQQLCCDTRRRAVVLGR